MKKAIIGIILLLIGIWLASSAGRQMAGGEPTKFKIPIRIDFELKGN